ncbi:MAG: TlpA disulfide reductase family protein, partial [Bacteroidota bacterium]
MKRIAIILILVVSVSQLRSQSTGNQSILSGEIVNSKSEEIIVRNNFWETIDTLHMQGNQFRDTLTLTQGYYYLVHEEAQIRLYLHAGMNLRLHVDLEDVVNSTNWKGKGQNENNYLASKFSLTQSIPAEKRMYAAYAKLNETDFLAQTDSVYQFYVDHFQKNKQELDPSFAYLEENSIQIANSIRISEYQSMKRLVEGDPNFKVSKDYPNPYVDIDLNNELLMPTYRYLDLMRNYISSRVMNSATYSDTSDFFLLFQKELSKSDLKAEIKDKLGLDISEYGFTYTKDKEAYYEAYMSFATLEVYREAFQERYDQLKMEKGNPSPNFEFLGLDGQSYSLDDFKGKYVYIDIWASWCSPCIAQIPHLKRIEEKYKTKVHFVSIAWSDNKTHWEKAIQTHNLTGNQLYAADK